MKEWQDDDAWTTAEVYNLVYTVDLTARSPALMTT